MEKICFNHPSKTAVGICHSCGHYFCENCLNEGSEYYYCNNPDCRTKYVAKMLPQVVKCPECLKEVDLNEKERVFKKFECQHCKAFINWKNYKNPGQPPIEYMYWGESMNMGDIALVQSILNEAEIDYFIEGANFIAVRPLVQPVKFHIRKGQEKIVRELLKNFEFHVFGASNASYKDSEND